MPEIKTKRGETVKSHRHRKVADHLHSIGMDYRMDVSVDLGGKKDIVDFYIPEIDMHVKIVEDDSLDHEKIIYERHGKRIIHLTPDELENLDDFFVNVVPSKEDRAKKEKFLEEMKQIGKKPLNL